MFKLFVAVSEPVFQPIANISGPSTRLAWGSWLVGYLQGNQFP